LNEQISKNVDLTKKFSVADKQGYWWSVKDLADTEKEKFEKMAENVEYESADKFREKLETIKESYFPKSKIAESTSKDEVDAVAANAPSDFTSGKSDAMAAYTAAITQNLKSNKI